MERTTYVRKCPYCGAENPLDAVVCINCGRQLPGRIIKIIRKKREEVILPHSPFYRVFNVFVRPHKVFPEIWSSPENGGLILTALLIVTFLFLGHVIAVLRFYPMDYAWSMISLFFMIDTMFSMVTHMIRVLLAATIISLPIKLSGKSSQPFLAYSAIVAYSYVPLLIPVTGYMIGAAVIPATSYTALLSTLTMFVNKVVFAAIMGGLSPFLMALGIKLRNTKGIDIIALLYLYLMSGAWILVYFVLPFI